MSNRHHRVFDAKTKKTTRIPFTKEEEVQKDLEEQILVDGKPLEDWNIEMSDTDNKLIKNLARTIEEFLDASPTILNNKPPAIKDLLSERKRLRASRPQ